jgi:orotate phosphoribosyltransferase
LSIEALLESGVKMHSILNILQITETLHEQKLVDKSILEKVKNQINK